MMILNQHNVDASAVIRPRFWVSPAMDVNPDRSYTQVINVAPVKGALTGENRLQANDAQITGVHAHAAVRMHAFPVSGSFWAYCPKTKTSHSQCLKVAP